ncbi:MAG: CPBP family intramembrane metalloprotease [Hyphomicrobium sp.]|nr:CPBP family intramembrane metalloprotease [Hyphomicrobium sp.]
MPFAFLPKLGTTELLVVAFVVLRLWLGRWRESWALTAAIVGELWVFLIVTALVGLAIVLGTYNALVYLIRPDLFMSDVAPFRPMLEAPLWPVTMLAVGIGAPLSEEFLFRGFLLSALARWRGGFWPAALLANAVWTSFHFGYSVAGVLEVFVGGLYLSWLLWRTGNLWMPIIAHAATNIFFLAVLALYPLP